jgi:hypothetical protein
MAASRFVSKLKEDIKPTIEQRPDDYRFLVTIVDEHGQPEAFMECKYEAPQ